MISLIERNTAVLFSIGHGIDQADYADAVSDFESASLLVAVEKREPETFAFLEYLAPSALAAYLLKPFTDKFLGKLADDSYEPIKAGLTKLWSRLVSKDRSVRWIMAGTKGKLSDRPLLTEVSFSARTSDGQNLRLLFPNDVSEECFVQTVLRFCRLVAQHDSDRESSPLGHQSRFPHWEGCTRILTVDEFQSFVEVDVTQSARHGRLVTSKLTKDRDDQRDSTEDFLPPDRHLK